MQVQIKTFGFRIIFTLFACAGLFTSVPSFGQQKTNTDSLRIARQRAIDSARNEQKRILDSTRSARQQALEAARAEQKRGLDSARAARQRTSDSMKAACAGLILFIAVAVSNHSALSTSAISIHLPDL